MLTKLTIVLIWQDFEFVIYTNLHDNIHVDNGMLKIKPLLADDKYGEGFVSTPNDIGPRCVKPKCKR